MSLDADIPKHIKKHAYKFNTAEAYTQNYDWLIYSAVMCRIPQRGWEKGNRTYF